MSYARRTVSVMFPLLASLLVAACAASSRTTLSASSSNWRSEASLCRDTEPGATHAIDAARIAAVSPLYTMLASGKDGAQKRLLGATLIVRTDPGMTVETLDRRIECHIARHQPGQMPIADDDPFATDGKPLEIHVQSAGPELRVDIAAPSAGEARAVLARAKRLVTRFTVTVGANGAAGSTAPSL